jgi:hypothetical protein
VRILSSESAMIVREQEVARHHCSWPFTGTTTLPTYPVFTMPAYMVTGACLKCGGTENSKKACLLQCATCSRIWHHSMVSRDIDSSCNKFLECLSPKVSLITLIELYQSQTIASWRCAQCERVKMAVEADIEIPSAPLRSSTASLEEPSASGNSFMYVAMKDQYYASPSDVFL